MARARNSRFDHQCMIAFQFHQALEDVVKDLMWIDKVIPRESSRHGSIMDADAEARAIIEGRKSDLLSYIQTICRDHIHFGKKLLDAGWTVDQHNRGKRKRRSE